MTEKVADVAELPSRNQTIARLIIVITTFSIGSMNSSNVISPYKYLDTWVFDDPRVGLVQEPFVSGADTMIDRVVEGIPDADNGFIMLFSAAPFPGHQITLEWTHPENGGNWYRSRELELDGWLCPALFKYFPEAPDALYVQVKERPAQVGAGQA